MNSALRQRQRRARVRLDLGHVLEVLPVHAAPGDAVVAFLTVIVAERGLDLRPGKPSLVEARAGLDFGLRTSDFGFRAGARVGRHVHAPQLDLDQRVAGEQVGPAQQQGVDGVGGGLGGLPVLGLLLLEQPDLAAPRPPGASPATSSKTSTMSAWVSMGARYHHQLSSASRQNMPSSSSVTARSRREFTMACARGGVAEPLQRERQVTLRLPGQR